MLNSCIRELDQASLAAISQQLTPRDDISMEVKAPFCLSLPSLNLWTEVASWLVCVCCLPDPPRADGRLRP